MKLLLAAMLTAMSVAPAAAAENRCGWLVNPTPGNYWLTDRDGMWVLATQGVEASDDVMLNLPEFDPDEYVASNGNYGYGCACLSVDLDETGENIVRVYSGRTIPLSRCENDKRLADPE